MNNRIPFNQDEIAKAIDLLQAEPHDIKAYFFTTTVQ
ncbi:MAG: DUF739 family protein [Mitsuokella sp.]